MKQKIENKINLFQKKQEAGIGPLKKGIWGVGCCGNDKACST